MAQPCSNSDKIEIISEIENEGTVQEILREDKSSPNSNLNHST
jgi:hypothetical protein